jgi:starvation-inducible outer membrane lipoprotein
MKILIIALLGVLFTTVLLSGCITSCPDLKGVELKNIGDVYFVTVENINLENIQVTGKTVVLGGTLCHTGNAEGENVNNYYCDIIFSNTEVNSQGTIVAKDKKDAKIIFNSNKEYIGTTCFGN